jgi:hypothetical protein
MTIDQPLSNDELDELASVAVDGVLADAQRVEVAGGDRRVVQRIAHFTALRSALLAGPIPDAVQGAAPGAIAQIATAQIAAAMTVFDELFPTTDSPPVMSPPPVVRSPISLHSPPRRRTVRRNTLAVFGIAAAVSLAVFGATRLGRQNDSKATSTATRTGAPVLGAAATAQPPITAAATRPADRQAPNVQAGDASVEQTGTEQHAPPAIDVPMLATDADLQAFVAQRLAATDSSASAAGSSTGPAAGGQAANTSAAAAALPAPASTAPTPGAFPDSTVGQIVAAPVTAAATAAPAAPQDTTDIRNSAPASCDQSADSQGLGDVLWHGQLATVVVSGLPDGSRVATVYSPTCSVLATVTV